MTLFFMLQELVEVEGFPDDARIVHIAAGDFHSAAVSGAHSSTIVGSLFL